MHYDFDRPVDRKTSLSVKWNPSAIASICGNPHATPYWVADMDFPLPEEVATKARQLFELGVFGYPYAPQQRTVFCTWAAKRHNLQLQADQVVISQGVLVSLSLLVEVLTQAGDNIIVPLPAYKPFVTIVNNLERNLLGWPLLYDEQAHSFSLDWDAFEALCSQSKLLIFCSPHNPSGLEFSKEELVRLCLIAKRHGVAIISDEIHADLSYAEHCCLLEPAKQVGCDAIVLMAPSKTFNIAGEHYSVTLFNDDVLKQRLLERMEQLHLESPSLTAITLALACYQEGGLWLQELLSYLRQNADYLADNLDNRVVFIKPKASYIGLLDCSAILDLVAKDEVQHPELYAEASSPQGGLLSRFFGQRAGIGVNDGTWFGGDAYKHFVRFNYGTQRASVERAVAKVNQAVVWLYETYGR